MTAFLQRFKPSAITGGAATAPLLILFGLNAVDELDRSAFLLLLPEIRDDFGLTNQEALSIVALVAMVALALQPFIGFRADRSGRVRIGLAGAALWAVFSFVTGLATVVAVLIVARLGSGIGRAVNEPVHNSLLADYYEPDVRPAVYGAHRAANSVGQIFGPLVGGLLAWAFNWRVAFLFFAVPSALLIVAGVRRLREPVRGAHERRLGGASEEAVLTEEAPPSLAESWRICTAVQTLRRLWYALPFLAASLVGLVTLTSLFYEEVFALNEAQRGIIAAVAEPFQLVGIIVGIPFGMRLFRRDVGLVLRFLALIGVVSGAAIFVFALAPNVATAVAMNIVASAVLGVLAPGLYFTLSLVIPPRARAMGYAIGALYTIPGLVILVIIGSFADSSGMRVAMMLLAPVLVLGGFIIASAGRFVAADIEKVRTSTVAQSEVLAGRRRGEVKLLLVKDLDVGYDRVQVLFGVDFEVDEGEIIALLGTNGAGKSTLLRAISGLVPASAGAVVFDGQDMTYAPPQEIAARGVVQVPGGKGVFPSLTVAENLRIAGWLFLKEPEYLHQATEQVLEFFPVLRERWEQPAGNLSGGEQQMLTLGQAFIAKPRLLMIDELSLGLAPVIVEQLLEIVKAMRDRGTTIILVEQSVNVALTVAETAYFMEKGEIRFRGPTRELLSRPDILRSVFLEGAQAATAKRRPRRRSPAVSNGHVTGAPLLEVEGLSKRFGGIAAVTDVSFTLHEGEILGIIGPNGAGKTTVFDLVSGFLPADTGRVTLAGEDLTEASPDARARRGLGRSFQDARLFPALTVTDTIALALERHLEVRDPVAAALHLPAVADAEGRVGERVEELLELMGLGAFADKFVSELSTGSRRIVDLACVLAHEPRAILFDEPSSGIAQRETEALGPMLQRMRDATGAGLLLIEHDMPLVTTVSDRMLALDLGQVVTDGPPADVVNHPKVVSSYLGESQDVIARSGTRRRRRPAAARK
ncbi:MAG: hypothetical protein QOG87_3437 [Actinomycetota bacterium]